MFFLLFIRLSPPLRGHLFISVVVTPETLGYNKILLVMTTRISEEHNRHFITRKRQSRNEYCEYIDTVDLWFIMSGCLLLRVLICIEQLKLYIKTINNFYKNIYECI